MIARTVGRVTRELVGAGVWLGGVDHSLRGVAASKFGRNLWCVLFAEGRGGVRALGLFSLRRLGSHRAIRPPPPCLKPATGWGKKVLSCFPVLELFSLRCPLWDTQSRSVRE